MCGVRCVRCFPPKYLVGCAVQHACLVECALVDVSVGILLAGKSTEAKGEAFMVSALPLHLTTE